MAYGKISPGQALAIKPHVKDRVVHDLGAGRYELAIALLGLGAERVIAIDKERMPALSDPRIVQVQARFEDAVGAGSLEGHWNREELERSRALVKDVDVAFMSWPKSEASSGLLELVRRAKIVIYLGKNTDGTSCGWPGLFRELAGHKVLAHMPERPNTLVIYGPKVKKARKLLGEEVAALTGQDLDSPIIFWEEAQAIDSAES